MTKLKEQQLSFWRRLSSRRPKTTESGRFRRTSSRSRSKSSLFNLGDAHLREQRQIVLDVPVVGDAAVRDLQQVRRDEIDRLALALGLAERAGEAAPEI